MLVEKFIAVDGGRLFYRIQGSGPAILLLHGIPADGTIWRNQLESLSGFKLIIPDLPGSGRSALTKDSSVEGMAGAMKKILEAEDCATVTLIGHSLGGYLSLALLDLFPSLIVGLALVHSTAYPDNDERKANRLKAIEKVKEIGPHAFFKGSVPGFFAPDHRGEDFADLKTLVDNTVNFSTDVFSSYYTAMMKRPDRVGLLHRVSSPILFVGGKFDTAVPLYDLLAQAHIPNTAYVKILFHSGHFGMLEEPLPVNNILKNYLVDLYRKS